MGASAWYCAECFTATRSKQDGARFRRRNAGAGEIPRPFCFKTFEPVKERKMNQALQQMRRNRLNGLGNVVEQEYTFKDLFIYEIDFPALAAAASATAQLAVQADSDFIWSKSAQMSDVAAAAQTVSTQVIPLASVLITDSGAGRQLMNTAVPIFNIFGNGQIPFILPRPRIFRSQSVVTVQVTNYSAATTYNIKLSFIGEKGFWK
jgi:hypothetical protein